MSMADIFAHASFDDHEQVIFVSDKESDLRGIIGIHNTVLGPAAGGCRMYPYASTSDALNDVLRLARGMTLKNAVAGLPLGGGKCVIIGDPASDKKEARLRAMARHVASLQGRYWTAIDVGVSAEDADIMAEDCPYIFARASDYTKDFPPSHFTTLGGFQGIRAVAKFLRGSDDMQGSRVAVQGVGQTGADLIAQLVDAGAEVIATDVNKAALAKVVEQHGIETTSSEDIHKQTVDIFAPCALGGILNDLSIPELNCKAVAGLANNQLQEARHGQQLLERGIAYVPDFVINAGGMMGASIEIFSTPNKEASLKRIAGIYDTVSEILQRSSKESLPTEIIAEQMAFECIHSEAKRFGPDI